MDGVIGEPAIVLIAFVVAAVFLVIEMAPIPTFGAAGTAAAILGAIGIVGLARTDVPWWPLLLCTVAVGLWGVMLARREAPAVQQAIAATAFAVGGLGFSIGARDWLAALVAVKGSIVLPAVFPRVFRAATRLLDQPSQVGLDSLVGTTGTVLRWEGTRGTVRVDGSLWNTVADHALEPATDVVVTGYDGMTLRVAAPIPAS